jgi:hypothetical protein
MSLSIFTTFLGVRFTVNVSLVVVVLVVVVFFAVFCGGGGVFVEG